MIVPRTVTVTEYNISQCTDTEGLEGSTDGRGPMRSCVVYLPLITTDQMINPLVALQPTVYLPKKWSHFKSWIVTSIMHHVWILENKITKSNFYIYN